MKTDHKWKLKWTELVILLALIAEFAFVAYVNLTRIPVTMDNDNAKLFTHAIEIWNTKQIFIPNWVNETMLELDTSLLLAVPLYGLTGNIYLSFGIANLLILLAFYFFTFSLLKRIGQPMSVRITACGLLTLPYSFGQLLYFNMMFFSGGFYGIKVLLPFMLIWLMTAKETERKVLFWVIAALTTVFTFIFSVSTGPYSLLCAIFPVVLGYVWFSVGTMKKGKELFSGWLFSVRNLLLYAQGIAAVLGIYISSRMQVDSTGSNMNVLDYHDFIENAQYLLSDFFELAGSFPNGAVRVMSVKGISSFAHFLLAMLALIAIIAIICRYFKRLKHTEEIAPSQEPIYYLLLVFLWNLLVLLVCEIMGQCRYLLMGLVPMIPLIAIFYRELVAKVGGTLQRGFLHFAFFSLICLAALLSDCTIMKDDCIPPMAGENHKYDTVVEMTRDYPEKQVFLWNDEGISENLRAYDYKSDREYLAYMPEDKGVSVHDYYEDRTDASYFTPDHLLLVSDYIGSIDDLPEYLKNCYTEADSYQNIHIYRAKENRMDGVCGYRVNPHSIDYCYTKDYTILYGELTDDGSLLAEGNGEACVSSPWLGCAADRLTVTLAYEVVRGDGVCGSLQIWDGDTHEIIAEAPLDADAKEAVIDNFALNGRNIVVQVTVNEGSTAKIKRFVYDR
ncbi:MAG: hypothetical protein IJU25_04105 [Lachnospiraceae bacterium]|nr:hypothetical protein [Lachnospiraceae bacterium]